MSIQKNYSVTVRLAGNTQGISIASTTLSVTKVAATSFLTGPQGIPGANGLNGTNGTNGADGAPGAGVATGGTTNQYLKKNSNTNYDTSWDTLDKTDVGLSNVDNTSDANKPVSTATQTALNAKYDTSNPSNYVNAAGASAAAPVQSVAGRTGAVTLTKTDVGLANVDNTSDANKPVSTAQAAADATKITGPASAANGNLISFNGTTGKVGQDSGINATTLANQISDLYSSKQNTVTLTTTGTSGSATFNSSTGALNIPNYSTGGGTGDVTGGASSVDNEVALYNGTTGKIIKSAGANGMTVDPANGNTTITGNFNIPSQVQFTSASYTQLQATQADLNFKALLSNKNVVFTVADRDILTLQYGKAIFTQPLQITAGTPGLNKVLTSDASGNASWATPATSGITRSVSNISTPTSAGAAANTDYVYFVTGTTTLTLPSPSGNTNRYTINNDGTGLVTVATASGTINGSATAGLDPDSTREFISNGTNWKVF